MCDGLNYEGRAISSLTVYRATEARLWTLTKYLDSYLGAPGVEVFKITSGGVFSGWNDLFLETCSARTMFGRKVDAADTSHLRTPAT